MTAGEDSITDAAPAADPIVFAHPSELEIARILDFYEVHWEYEPRTFPLNWDETTGQPNQFFTPDFYLTEYDLFIEVTTMKPSLTHRKHRKIRRLRELYPAVNIKLLALKDVEALMQRFGGSGQTEEERETP